MILRSLSFFICCLFGLALSSTSALARDHIRVVLDTSKSMIKNDPGRMTILSTLMLHDLAQPNTTLGDTFKVIPFYPKWDWINGKKTPPTENSPFIISEFGKRQDFVDKLKRLEYDADWTHFYPVLAAAIKDLKTTGKKTDTRTVILLTDGIPDDRDGTKNKPNGTGNKPNGTLNKEIYLIQKNVLPELTKQNIRLYVLAFSPEVVKNKSFFDLMTNGETLGKVFIDPKGDHLLEEMIELFAASLGYNADKPISVPAVSNQILPLNLNKGGNPTRAAVVVLTTPTSATPPGSLTLPALKLAPTPNIPDGILGESTLGAAYNLGWVLSPTSNPYDFSSDVTQGSVAVLHPIKVRLELKPRFPQTQIFKTMASVPMSAELVVNSEYGGDPGKVDVNFQLQALPPVEWKEDKQAPPPTTSSASNIYEIPAVFYKNEAAPSKPYSATISAQVWRGAKMLGELDPPHKVDVFPFLSIAPKPSQIYISNDALQRGDLACIQFNLELNAGYLPDSSSYPLRVVLIPSDPKQIENEFNQARFTLDDKPLQFDTSSSSSSWSSGSALSKDKFIAKQHELCLKVGKPKAGDPSKPIDLPVQFTLQMSPYDDFKVIKPLILRIKLEQPILPLNQWILLSTLVLLTSALLWYFRNRPSLAPDLGYAIATERENAELVFHALTGGSQLKKLLGLTVEKPISIDHLKPLAWVKPIKNELYQLRLARGNHLETINSNETPLISFRGLFSVIAQRTYRLRTQEGAYLLRLEYRQDKTNLS